MNVRGQIAFQVRTPPGCPERSKEEGRWRNERTDGTVSRTTSRMVVIL